MLALTVDQESNRWLATFAGAMSRRGCETLGLALAPAFGPAAIAAGANGGPITMPDYVPFTQYKADTYRGLAPAIVLV
jgi:hypothetical protein